MCTQAVAGAGLLPRLLELLTHRNEGVQAPVMRTLLHLGSSQNDAVAGEATLGIIAALPQLLDCDSQSVRRRAVRLACTMSHNEQFTPALRHAGVATAVIALLNDKAAPLDLRCTVALAQQEIVTSRHFWEEEVTYQAALSALGGVLREPMLYESADVFAPVLLQRARLVLSAAVDMWAARNDRQGVLYHIAIAAGVTWDIVPALLNHPAWTPEAHAAFPPAFKAAARLVVTAAQIGRRASCADPNTRKRRRDETDGGGIDGSGSIGGIGASSTCAIRISGVGGATHLNASKSGAATCSSCRANSIATTGATGSGSCRAGAGADACAAGASTAGIWSLNRDLIEQILSMAALPMCTWCSFRLTVPPRRPGKPRMITTRRRRSSISSSAVAEVAAAQPAVIADGGGTAASAAGAA